KSKPEPATVLPPVASQQLVIAANVGTEIQKVKAPTSEPASPSPDPALGDWKPFSESRPNWLAGGELPGSPKPVRERMEQEQATAKPPERNNGAVTTTQAASPAPVNVAATTQIVVPPNNSTTQLPKPEARRPVRLEPPQVPSKAPPPARLVVHEAARPTESSL